MPNREDTETVGLRKRSVEHRSDVPHGLGRERTPVWMIFRKHAAAVLKPVDHVLDLRRCEAADPGLANVTIQIPGEVGITLVGPWRCIRLARFSSQYFTKSTYFGFVRSFVLAALIVASAAAFSAAARCLIASARAARASAASGSPFLLSPARTYPHVTVPSTPRSRIVRSYERGLVQWIYEETHGQKAHEARKQPGVGD